MGNAYFIVDHPVGLQVGGTLVELLTILKAHTVHHQVIVEMLCVHMGGYQHLEVWKLPPGQLQPHSVNCLWGQVILLVKGLHEVVVLSAVCLMEPLLGELHLGADALSGAVPSGDKLPIFPCGFLPLLDVSQHTAQSTSAAATIFNCGEGCHLVNTSSISFASSLIG